jgi:hypothetical protein
VKEKREGIHTLFKLSGVSFPIRSYIDNGSSALGYGTHAVTRPLAKDVIRCCVKDEDIIL